MHTDSASRQYKSVVRKYMVPWTQALSIFTWTRIHYFPKQTSFESLHGSPIIVQHCLADACKSGRRMMNNNSLAGSSLRSSCKNMLFLVASWDLFSDSCKIKIILLLAQKCQIFERLEEAQAFIIETSPQYLVIEIIRTPDVAQILHAFHATLYRLFRLEICVFVVIYNVLAEPIGQNACVTILWKMLKIIYHFESNCHDHFNEYDRPCSEFLHCKIGARN